MDCSPATELKMALSEIIPSIFCEDHDQELDAHLKCAEKLVDECFKLGLMDQVKQDICSIVQLHTRTLSEQLFCQFQSSLSENALRASCEMLLNLHKLMFWFTSAIKKIFYLLKSVNGSKSFEEVLLSTFKTEVVHIHSKDILDAVKLVRRTPFAVDPSILHDLVTGVYKMLPELHLSEQQLFSYYVPNVKKPCTSDQLEHEIIMAKQLQAQLKSNPDFVRVSPLKRTIHQQVQEDKECPSTLLSTLLMDG